MNICEPGLLGHAGCSILATMRTLHLVGLVALLGSTACYREYGAASTMPQSPDPVSVSGPPGGEMDPGYGYQAPGEPGYPAGYPSGDTAGYPNGYPTVDPYAGSQQPATDPWSGASDPTAEPAQEVSADPQDPGYTVGDVTDGEIDQTLQPYGQWIEDEEYGRVWRPDPTVVGVNFTPYETNGSWVSTDYGPAFDSEWDWGWLAFHYGCWDWFDAGYWGWVPDYSWSPAQVEWRSGGGYVGWRPLRPRVRDHRGSRGGGGPIVRDHRHGTKDSQWRFAAERDFGKHNIHAHTFSNLAEGLHVTAPVTRPPSHLVAPNVKAASIMHGRLNTRFNGTRAPGRDPRPSRFTGTQPTRTYQPPTRTYNPPARTYQPPTGSTYQPPARTYQPPTGSTYQPPTRTYQPPARTYNPPTRTYQPPTRTYNPPTGSTYQPPTRTYNPPTRSTYTPPSRSYNPPARSTYTPPARSTYSPPSHSSSSYSSPSRSSSSSSPSHSSSSSSHSSSSSSHSSSSSSSSSHSSGSRHR